MENKIDVAFSKVDRDKVLDFLAQIRALLTFLADLTPEQRHSLVKMGDAGLPFVQAALNLVEQDESFMPRSFDRTEMREDKELYDLLLPVFIQLLQLFEAVEDTMMLVGSDLMLNALDVYRNAKGNGKGENLDEFMPFLSRRFKRNAGKTDENAETKKDDDTDNEKKPA